MSTIHEIDQVIYLDTPKGQALAKFLICHGIDSDLLWVTVVQDSGECWTFSNEDIRFSKNLTLGRCADWDDQI